MGLVEFGIGSEAVDTRAVTEFGNLRWKSGGVSAIIDQQPSAGGSAISQSATVCKVKAGRTGHWGACAKKQAHGRNKIGEVPEWLNGAVSKTVVGLKPTVGSNPTLSAERKVTPGSRSVEKRM